MYVMYVHRYMYSKKQIALHPLSHDLELTCRQIPKQPKDCNPITKNNFLGCLLLILGDYVRKVPMYFRA